MFGPRLAQALVKPDKRGDILIVITLEFLTLERPGWLPRVQAAIRAGEGAMPLDLANAELAKMEADHAKDPLWELFAAFCRFGAEDVFFEWDFLGGVKKGPGRRKFSPQAMQCFGGVVHACAWAEWACPREGLWWVVSSECGSA